MNKLLASVAAFVALSHQACAMDFKVYAAKNGNEGVYMSGKIVSGDEKKLLSVLEEHPKIVLASLNSPGGGILTGQALAKIIRDNNIQTEVADNQFCVSACFELFSAGTRRFVGENTSIGVHRVSYDGVENHETRSITIAYAGRMEKYGVPKSILASLMLQPAASMYYLTKTDLDALGVVWTKSSSSTQQSVVVKPSVSSAPYSVVYNSAAPAPVPAPTETETDTVDPVLEKMQQFDDAYAKATAVSRAQNRGRPATTRNCDRKSCEEILGFRDKNGQYVELHRSLVTSSRFVCRLTQEGVFNDEYRCTNYLTGEAKVYRWSRDPLL